MPKNKTFHTLADNKFNSISFIPDTDEDEKKYIRTITKHETINQNQIQKVKHETYINMVNNKIKNDTTNINNKCFVCECGDKVLLIHKLKHARTLKHRNFIKIIQ
jgi:hypothetical protein